MPPAGRNRATTRIVSPLVASWSAVHTTIERALAFLFTLSSAFMPIRRPAVKLIMSLVRQPAAATAITR
ncbi:hypothetical protein ADL03_32475 [Nocardia sp. NRRL S-836]|nr:hypothetical protein ADL03_32475 [Nocardia sp. NRRL S-836]